jgi:hypothetical protein
MEKLAEGFNMDPGINRTAVRVGAFALLVFSLQVAMARNAPAVSLEEQWKAQYRRRNTGW